MSSIDFQTLRMALIGLLREQSPLAALRVLYQRQGGFFQIPLPGFRAFVVGGPAANRQVLVSEREKLRWRSPEDPVTALLRQGVLVVDGPDHDRYRSLMEPLLAPGALPDYVGRILQQVDRVAATWQPGQTVDMLVECRRIALLIIMDILFGVDCWEDLPRLWQPILKAIQYISPGMWVLFPNLPRLGYRKHRKILDEYLYEIIHARRSAASRHDLLGHLIAAGLDDEQIRDQMLTMLIAGHDTSTALLAWTFYLLGSNPGIYARLQKELDEALPGDPPAPGGWQPRLLDEVIKESLRLYPPIHLGSRRLAEPLEVDGHMLPAGERLIYSIYLTHRDPAVWENADQFAPQRFAPDSAGEGRHRQPPFAYLPFGGGPRACLGAAFGLVEARLVLARLLKKFDFQLVSRNVHAGMGATLEPKPGVLMRVQPRR